MDERLSELFHLIHLKSVNIDNEETGKRMKIIRITNDNLIKYVCRHSRLGQNLRLFTRKKKRGKRTNNIDPCGNNFDCKNCKLSTTEREEEECINTMAYCSAGQMQLGRCYGKSEKQINALEARGECVTIENILTYAYMAKVPLTEIIQLQKGYYFDDDGIIRRTGEPEYMLAYTDEKEKEKEKEKES